jgi:hypothetical protein
VSEVISGWPESELGSEVESEVGMELESIMEDKVGVEMIGVLVLVEEVWRLSSDLRSQ